MARVLTARRRQWAVLVISALITAACNAADRGSTSTNATTATSSSTASTDGTDTSTTSAASTSTTSEAGGTLVVDTSFQLTTIDPGRAAERTPLIVASLVYDTLLDYDNGTDLSRPSPSLAESYTASPDNTEFTFTLRDGLTFSDGAAVTAADVAFSFNRLKNLAGILSFMASEMTVTASDDRTVVIQSASPDPSIPSKVATYYFSVLNSELVRTNGGTDAADAADADQAERFLNESSAGTGPYMIETVDPSSQIVLTANPNYWGPAPGYDRIVLRNVSAPNQVINIQSGESQLALDVSPVQASTLSGDLQVSTTGALDMFYVGFTTDPAISPVAANPDFQEAVKYAIDYEGILELVGQGSVRSSGIVMAGQLGSVPESEALVQDLDRAREALSRAGLENPTIDMDYYSDVTPFGVNVAAVAAKIQADLGAVGITVNLLGSPQTVGLQKYRNGESAMVLSDFDPPMPGPFFSGVFLPGGAFGSRLHWEAGAQPDLEELGVQAAAAATDEERETLWQEVVTQMQDVGPYAVLFQPAAVVVGNSSVGTLQANAVSVVDWHLLGENS